MTGQREDKRIPFCDITKGLNQGIEIADPLRTAGLERLARVRAIKETGLKREQERLKAKLGAEHPRVSAIATKLDANRELKRDVELGLSRVATPAVRPEENSWVLHGHVRDKNRAGVPNLTVALYDDKGQWIRELGYACTDKSGYFKLLHSRAKPGVTDVGKEGEAPKTGSGKKVYIHVTNAQGTHLYVDKQPLTPEPGRVDYREIILGEDAVSCVPPPSSPQPKLDSLETEPQKETR